MDISKEQFFALGDVADIRAPDKAQSGSRGKLLDAGDLHYPLSIESLQLGEITNIELRNGDIVVTPSLELVYLVEMIGNHKIYLSRPLLLIRIREEFVDPYFLTLYLKSKAAKEYALSVTQGSAIKSLAHFSVPIPDLLTQRRSKELFDCIYASPLKEIGDFQKEISSGVPSAEGKELQKQALQESMGVLIRTKRKLVKAIIGEDLREMDGCIANSYFKSFLVLSGSVVEAVLLDWLSDIDHRNYFDPSIKDVSLFTIIKKIHEAGALSDEGKERADRVRNNRNIVHPRRHLSSGLDINEDLCKEVLEDIKHVLEERERDYTV